MEMTRQMRLPNLRFEADVLIVGAGAAGIRAAVAAHDAGAKVVLVSALPVASGGSTFYPLSLPWGALYAEEKAEDRQAFLEELQIAGAGFQDDMLEGVMVERSAKACADLRSWGIELNDLVAVGEVPCFGSHPRGVRLKNSAAARQRFAAQIHDRGIACIEFARIFDLIVEDGCCIGVLGADQEGRLFAVASGAVVLATGGAEGLWCTGFSSGDTMGDGYAMGARAGARLVNLEFIQFIPGIVSPVRGVNFHHRSLSSLPAILNSRGEDGLVPFLPQGLSEAECLIARSKHGPFSCEGMSRYFDFALCAAGSRSGLSVLYNANFFRDDTHAAWRDYLASIGINPAVTSLGIFPHCQAFNGGVLIGEDCRTDIEGLFACGECAGGVHGADRVGGAAILAALVFGTIAGENAAHAACMQGGKRELPERIPALPPSAGAAELSALAGKVLQTEASIIRSAEGLSRGLIELELGAERQEHGFGMADESHDAAGAFARNACTVAQLLLTSMLARQESRGPHYRSDFPPDTGRPSIGRRNAIGMHRDGSLFIEEGATPVKHSPYQL